MATKTLLTLARSSSSRFFNPIRNASSSKIYELRTYNIKPECMKPFVDLSLEKFHIRTRFSVLHGYWTAEIGGINQVVHIWEYDNYVHRANVRKELAGNQDWISQYFSKILPMFTTQTNVGMMSLDNGDQPDIIHPEGQGVYELWSMTTENYVHRGVKELKSSLEGSIDGNGKSILCGSFRSTLGPQGNVYFLMRHENFDEAIDFRTQWLSNKGM